MSCDGDIMVLETVYENQKKLKFNRSCKIKKHITNEQAKGHQRNLVPFVLPICRSRCAARSGNEAGDLSPLLGESHRLFCFPKTKIFQFWETEPEKKTRNAGQTVSSFFSGARVQRDAIPLCGVQGDRP